ncbi:MAG: hypothetical protein ABI852_13410 [Gemmatimonadaceae bacterium]
MQFSRLKSRSTNRRISRVLAAAVLAGVCATSIAPALSAQSSSASDGPKHAFTVNPFFVLAGWVSGEYEQRVNNTLTLGGGFSYVDFDDNRYTNFELKGRLYPNERAMRGFEMAMSVGVTHLNFDDNNFGNDCVFLLGSTTSSSASSECGTKRKAITTPAVGLEFAYQWALGSTHRTMLALGGGGKRFLASKKELDGTSRVIPTFRIGIGYGW